MTNPRLASRYAKALLDLAIEKGQLETVFADVQWLNEVSKTNRDFVNVLRSPIIKGDAKIRILDAVTKGNIGELTQAFITLLINKNRELNLPEIGAALEHQYYEHKNIHIATLTTATPVSEQMKAAIINKAKAVSGFDTIQLREKVDPAIIGGFVLELDDKMVDASVAHDLKMIAKQFAKNDYIYAIN